MTRRKLAGSRGLVTGASSGIGRAIALELLAAGARLVVVARRRDRLESLVQQMPAGEGVAPPVELVAGDICDGTVRHQALERAEQAFGGLDFLVNAAGISSVARFSESTPERLREIMEVNFFAPAELIRAAVPALERGYAPLIVNLGSILGFRGIPWHADYCASKFALQGLSESIRPELRRQGIDLLVVSPGTTKTELYDQDLGRSRLPWPQPKGVSAEYVARRTVRAMQTGRQAIIPNPQGRVLVGLSRWCPWLLDRLLGKYG